MKRGADPEPTGVFVKEVWCRYGIQLYTRNLGENRTCNVERPAVNEKQSAPRGSENMLLIPRNDLSHPSIEPAVADISDLQISCNTVGIGLVRCRPEVEPHDLAICKADPDHSRILLHEGVNIVTGKPETIVLARQEVHEPVAHWIIEARAGRICAHPKTPLGIDEQPDNTIRRKAVRVRRFVAIDTAGVSVVPGKAVDSSDPDESCAITDHVGPDLV